MATLAVGSINQDDDEMKDELQMNECKVKMYDYIIGLGNSKSKSSIWNEIVDLILKYIEVDNLIASKSQIQEMMVTSMDQHFETFISINQQLELMNCLRTDIKGVLEQVVNHETTYILTQKNDTANLIEEDGCYVKYPMIAWYLYENYYKELPLIDLHNIILPEPNEMRIQSIINIDELITYIRNAKWNQIHNQPRRSSVARMEDVLFVDEEDVEGPNKPPTPAFTGQPSNLFRTSDFEKLPPLKIPEVKGWIKNVVESSETSTPERYARSQLFYCDICKKEGKNLKPMNRQTLTDHIQAKHSYHHRDRPLRRLGDEIDNLSKKKSVSPSLKHPGLKKMSTQDTDETYPYSSSLSIKRRLSPSKSPSVASISRKNSANNLPLLKMNSKDSLDSNTPSRKPHVKKKQRLRSHSSGNLDEELLQQSSSGLGVKRSTSFESTFSDRKVSPKSNDDTRAFLKSNADVFDRDYHGNTFEPLYDLMAHESLKKDEDEDEDDKYKKKGGKSKSRRRRKKRTKKKSRRKKRN